MAPEWISQGDVADAAHRRGQPEPGDRAHARARGAVEGRARRGDARPGAPRAACRRRDARDHHAHAPAGAVGRFAGCCWLRTGFPLGLAFAEAEVASSGQHVCVYPRLFRVAYVPIAGEQFLEGDVLSPRSGGVEEFAGVREYRARRQPAARARGGERAARRAWW